MLMVVLKRQPLLRNFTKRPQKAYLKSHMIPRDWIYMIILLDFSIFHDINLNTTRAVIG